MEFLATPDLGGDRSAWHSVTPASAALPAVTPRAHHSPSSRPASPPSGHSAPASATPQANHPAPFYPHLDRAGIKNSFQSLFSPSPAATPALFRSHGPAPGLTPFINGMATPNLAPPGSNMMSSYPNGAEQQRPAMSPDVLSSPYLQAAAKEAVRREFLNMPSYVASKGTPKPAERIVPEKVSTPVSQSQSPDGSAQPLVSPSSGDAKVPAPPPIVSLDASDMSSPGKSTSAAQSGELGASDASPVQQPYSQGMQQQQPSLPSHMHPYFMQAAHHPQQRMLMIGQHGQVMMAGPHPGMYAPPPGMMMFPGGQPQFQRPGMMMQPPHGAPHMVRPPGPPVKPETQEERKKRIEVEKQELIREFKKKTREAALVRFRQKRRERRFGKLIRYDCRKKLADARPRVKGRFVRIKEDEESDTAQVVPGLDD